MKDKKKKDGMKPKSTPPPSPETKAEVNPAAENTAGVAPETIAIDETALLKEEVAALKDQMLRAMAEAENTRKRTQRDLEDGRKYAVTSFARDLLNVLDNFYRTEEHMPKDAEALDPAVKNVIDGINMTRNELVRVFESHGIRRIDPKGEAFDHNLHQAVAQVPDAKVAPGTVVHVVQAGYMLHDRLLRPAMVAVSAAPNTPA